MFVLGNLTIAAPTARGVRLIASKTCSRLARTQRMRARAPIVAVEETAQGSRGYPSNALAEDSLGLRETEPSRLGGCGADIGGHQA